MNNAQALYNFPIETEITDIHVRECDPEELDQSCRQRRRKIQKTFIICHSGVCKRYFIITFLHISLTKKILAIKIKDTIPCPLFCMGIRCRKGRTDSNVFRNRVLAKILAPDTTGIQRMGTTA
jgi:hypothetical protein